MLMFLCFLFLIVIAHWLVCLILFEQRAALTYTPTVDSRTIAAIISLAAVSVFAVIAWNRYSLWLHVHAGKGMDCVCGLNMMNMIILCVCVCVPMSVCVCMRQREIEVGSPWKFPFDLVFFLTRNMKNVSVGGGKCLSMPSGHLLCEV